MIYWGPVLIMLDVKLIQSLMLLYILLNELPVVATENAN